MKISAKHLFSKKMLPYLALLGAQIIWGGNFVVAKLTLTEIPIMTLAFLRFSLASILIIPFLLSVKKRQKISVVHLPLFFLIGVLMVTFNIAFFYEGISRIPAINASIIELIIPILSVLAGWWFLREHIYWINLLGILIGSAGVFAIIGFPFLFTSSMSISNLLGNILVLMASVVYVAGALLSKKMLEIYSPLTLTASLFLVGAVTFFIPAILEYVQNPNWVTHISLLSAIGILYITALSSVVAFFLLAWGLAKVELSKANLFQYITPAVAALFAVPLLHERISFSLIIGFCLVILGVYWGTLGKAHHHHIHHSSHRI